MSKVNILPESIVSKIAAGEVIERPASVIKELVENALDAKATSIEVRLKDAGKTSIIVKDNGQGIAHDDLENIFHRHATSKIASVDDLYEIHSLGFRGEALYSIAAISDTVLRSKTKDQDSGWEIHMRAGKQLQLKPCTMADSGTEIEIKELFFNTPARRKFLKTNTTEINQVLNTFTPYTLLHNNVRFRLSHQDRELIDLPATDSISQRVASALRLEEENIMETRQELPQTDSFVNVLLGDINIKRTRRDMQYIFVNGRPVQNKSIAYHMNQVYRLLMPGDEFPFFAVYIQIPAQDVDVNIHPTKREVKIKDERGLCSLIRSVCEQKLMTAGKIKMVKETAIISEDAVITRKVHRQPLSDTFENISPSEIIETADKATSDDYAFAQQQTFMDTGTNLQKKLENARFIGSFINKFLLFESGNDLLLVDQHAAAERITYEQLMRQMEKSQIEVQNLLSPILIKLTAQEMNTWEEAKDTLESMGLSSSQFDNETIAVHTHPQLLKDPEKAVRHILVGEKVPKSDFATMARRACRSSIMAGDRLNPEKAEFLREQLLQCGDPFTCPHGRPTVVEMSEAFLDKQFLRK